MNTNVWSYFDGFTHLAYNLARQDNHDQLQLICRPCTLFHWISNTILQHMFVKSGNRGIVVRWTVSIMDTYNFYILSDSLIFTCFTYSKLFNIAHYRSIHFHNEHAQYLKFLNLLSTNHQISFIFNILHIYIIIRANVY